MNARCSTKNNQICNFCAKSDSIFSWIPGQSGELYQVPEFKSTYWGLEGGGNGEHFTYRGSGPW